VFVCVSVLHGISMSLPLLQLSLRCRPAPTVVSPRCRLGPAQPIAVFTSWLPVPEILVTAVPVSCSSWCVSKRHDVESGVVSRPIAATCKDVAACRGTTSTLYSQSCGITTAVTLASGSTA